jgi:hypothetical protein
MGTKNIILLPNPISYLDFISKSILDSFDKNEDTTAEAYPITEVSKMLVYKEGILVIKETKE